MEGFQELVAVGEGELAKGRRGIRIGFLAILLLDGFMKRRIFQKSELGIK